MNCYKVMAKCGHVKRNNYILKMFYVCAVNGKEAASIVRKMGRVKHHQKDAIREVESITYEEYLKGKEKNLADPYLNVHNPRDQKISCDFGENEIIREVEPELFKKKTHAKRRLIESVFIKEWKAGGVMVYE